MTCGAMTPTKTSQLTPLHDFHNIRTLELTLAQTPHARTGTCSNHPNITVTSRSFLPKFVLWYLLHTSQISFVAVEEIWYLSSVMEIDIMLLIFLVKIRFFLDVKRQTCVSFYWWNHVGILCLTGRKIKNTQWIRSRISPYYFWKYPLGSSDLIG